MSLASLPGVFWLGPPVVGALLGLAFARVAMALAMRHMADSSAIQKPLEGTIRTLIGSTSFLRNVRQTISTAVATISALPMSEAIAKINARSVVIERILPILASERTRAAIAGALAAATEHGSQPLTSDDLLKRLSGPLGEMIPGMVERLIEWLESVEMRDLMAARGRELLPRILERLNVMQRFLVSAGQFDKRLDENMPEIVEETIQALERIMRDPAQQQAFQEKILLAVGDWGERQRSRPDAALLISQLVNRYLEGLAAPKAKEAVYRFLEAHLTEGKQPVGGFLRRSIGISDTDVSDSATNLILSWLSRPQTAASVSAKIADAAAGLQKDGSFVTVRARFLRLACIAGACLGLAVGLCEDLLRLLGVS